MTLTRIWLRLEVKNDCKIVDFSYTAPDLEQELQEFEVQSGKWKRKRKARKNHLTSEKEAQVLLGQRKYQTYTIQTYFNEMATSDENRKTIEVQKEESKKVKEDNKNEVKELENKEQKGPQQSSNNNGLKFTIANKKDTKSEENKDDQTVNTICNKDNNKDNNKDKNKDNNKEEYERKEWTCIPVKNSKGNKRTDNKVEDNKVGNIETQKQESTATLTSTTIATLTSTSTATLTSTTTATLTSTITATLTSTSTATLTSTSTATLTSTTTATLTSTSTATKATFSAVLMGANKELDKFTESETAYNALLPKNSMIHFFSGNPAVECAEGVLHLYKENHLHHSHLEGLPPTHIVSMICIPATVCLQDLLQFLKPVCEDLELIRIVKSSAPNEYMALLKFRSLDQAHEFYKVYNGKAFNGIEPDICHLVFVAHVECAKSLEGAGKPFPKAVELPVCAVCLEKMDESVEGILTILCNHSFHAPCMAQCEDFTCPVCRYMQTPVPVAGNMCFQCSIHEDLWICLICGEVGCGRYTNGHAYNHFQDTAHTFAMQLGSNRVWDYVGENYVHRLVMNKMDGKLVEVGRGAWVDGGSLAMQDDKFESLSLEYTYLLTNQLESQREYFENKMKIIESAKEKQLQELNMRVKEMSESRENNSSVVLSCTKDKHVMEKRCNLLSTKLTKVQSCLEEEKEMNQSLRQNQQEWQTKVIQLEGRLTAKETESVELREQLRDIMFYLEAKNQLTSENSDVTAEELQNSHVVLPPEQQSSSRGGKKSGKRKK